MMSQEEFMDVMALRRAGWTFTDIAERVGRHPQTVSAWLRRGGPPAARQADPAALAVDERWRARIEELLEANPNLLATSLLRLLAPEGFDGSYQTLTRHLRAVRGVRKRRSPLATMAIDTPAGEEAQADWADCRGEGVEWGLGPLHCFAAILAWSRYRLWWFAPSTDRAHTLEGLVRFFETVGGVPAVVRIDKLTPLVAAAAPRARLQPAAVEFARAHGCKFVACRPGDAQRKGKVERPFRELREAFLEELRVTGTPGSIGEAEPARPKLAHRAGPRPRPPGHRGDPRRPAGSGGAAARAAAQGPL